MPINTNLINAVGARPSGGPITESVQRREDLNIAGLERKAAGVKAQLEADKLAEQTKARGIDDAIAINSSLTGAAKLENTKNVLGLMGANVPLDNMEAAAEAIDEVHKLSLRKDLDARQKVTATRQILQQYIVAGDISKEQGEAILDPLEEEATIAAGARGLGEGGTAEDLLRGGATIPQAQGVISPKGLNVGELRAKLAPIIASGNATPEQVKTFNLIKPASNKQTLTLDSEGNLTLTQGEEEGLTKGATTSVEKEIIDAEQTIGQLNAAEGLLEDDFLTTVGKARSFVSSSAEKLGFKTDEDFLEARSKWLTQSKSAFLAYRKWVTGVAGGEKEFKEIAKAFPDPDTNSPTQYRANLDQTRTWTRAVSKWLRETKAQGLSIEDTREIVAQQEPEVSGDVTEADIDNMSLEELKAFNAR